MSLLCRSRPSLSSISRNISQSAVLQRRPRNHYEKLEQPEDKSSVIIGKRKPSVYHPKEGVSDKTHPIAVSWKRPVTIQNCNPCVSGDVGGLESLGLDKLDLSGPPVKMENSQALAAASPEVKRVLSLEFARKKDVIAKLSLEVVKSVQRHPRDFDSPEVKIALQTVSIRNMQYTLIQQWPYKNQNMKHFLTYLLASRRKRLGILRTKDYRKYEWLLEKLNLLYKPMPWDAPEGVVQNKELVARRSSIEKLTDMWCEELRQHRLKAYRKQLESRQPEFLREKAKKYQTIIADEKELGIPQSVAESEIAEWLEKATEIESRIEAEKEKDEDKDEEYLVYRIEEAKEENVYISNM